MKRQIVEVFMLMMAATATTHLSNLACIENNSTKETKYGSRPSWAHAKDTPTRAIYALIIELDNACQ